VLDPGVLQDSPQPGQLYELAGRAIGGAGDYEEALNLARRTGQEQAFLIGARLLSGTIEPQQAGEAYALLAEGLIAALQKQVEGLMMATHGRVPEGDAVVLAMGKLGGREMTATSDLDLIIIYDAGTVPSTGLKPLPAMLYYSRFTQRLISALSAGTGEGHLYEVDMRLRPSGNSGPVATSLPAFVDYQAKQAWTWEHMALTRARVISGPPALRERLAAVIAETLAKPRDAAQTARDVREMRDKVAAHKRASDPWDLKYVRGGLVDVEFIAQYLQLIHAASSPAVLKQNTIEALTALREAGHLDADAAAALIGAARLYQALTQILRLCVEGTFVVAAASAGVKARLAQAAGAPDFTRVEAELQERLGEVSKLFDVIIPAST
jgi:glutamate-ammonia-ligase adenylyltransferase